jgi:hypothetical protein
MRQTRIERVTFRFVTDQLQSDALPTELLALVVSFLASLKHFVCWDAAIAPTTYRVTNVI